MPHGVTPPAQLLCVPARLTYSRIRVAVAGRPRCRGAAAGAGVVGEARRAAATPGASLPPISWLLTRTVPPRAAAEDAVPSGSAGRGAAVASAVDARLGRRSCRRSPRQREHARRVGDQRAVAGGRARCRRRRRGCRSARCRARRRRRRRSGHGGRRRRSWSVPFEGGGSGRRPLHRGPPNPRCRPGERRANSPRPADGANAGGERGHSVLGCVHVTDSMISARGLRKRFGDFEAVRGHRRRGAPGARRSASSGPTAPASPRRCG